MSVAAGWTPLRIDLFPNRWTPFRFVIGFTSHDFTGSDFAMQVRPYPDAETSLMTLLTAPPGAQGISATNETGVPGIMSQIVIEIYEPPLNGLPFPTPRGSDLVLSWDMVATGPIIPKRRWFEGAFTVRAGTTHV